jgi:hypothetical protein
MKTKLLIKERLYLMNILPQQNSLVEYQLKKSIIKKVEITDEDKNLVDFKQESENNVTWDAKKDADNQKEFEFTDQECLYVRKAIEALSDGEHPDEYWIIVTMLYDKLDVTKC